MTTERPVDIVNNRFPLSLLLQEKMQQTSDAADAGGDEPASDTDAVAAAKSYREKRRERERSG